MAPARIVFSRDAGAADGECPPRRAAAVRRAAPRRRTGALWATGALGAHRRGRRGDGPAAARAGRTAGVGHERHAHRPVAHERHGARRGDQIQAGLQPGSHRGAPAADRGGEPRRQRRHRSSWASRPSRRRRRPTVRSPAAVISRRCTASPSRSRGTSTSPARRRRRDSRRSRARTRPWTRPSSSGCGPPGRSRSAAPTCPNIAIRWHTDSELWGATVNPWDRSRTPGASSGGEAAALATGMSPLGLGNDGLGSLRWPAQCCGISALKPTLGRIPDATSVEPADCADRHPADGRRRARWRGGLPTCAPRSR